MTVAEASELAGAYREEQLRNRAGVLAELYQAWSLLSPDDVGGSFERALPGMVQVLEAGARTAVQLAAGYLAGYVGLATGQRIEPPRLDYLGDRPLVTSLLTVAGRITALQQIGRGAGPAQALDKAFARTARAAGSRTLDVGRVALDMAMDAEPLVVGWQRVTSSDPCVFCRGLAARGPVYRERTVRFEAHPRCGCTAEPVIRGAKVKGRPAPDVGHDRDVDIDDFWAQHNERYGERRERQIQARIAMGERVRGRTTTGARRPARPVAAEPARTAEEPRQLAAPEAPAPPAVVDVPELPDAVRSRERQVSERPPDPVAEAEQLADAWRAGHIDGQRLASGQGGAGVRRVTLSDGAEAVYRSAQGPDEARNEYLAGLVARAIGIPRVRTALVGPRETVSTLVPGSTGVRAGATLDDMVRLQGGREIGLMDWLTAQADRNSANFIVDGDSVFPIDHEYANFQWLDDSATAEMLSPFSWAHLSDSVDIDRRDDVDRLVSPFSAGELAEIRQRLEALAPEFDGRDAGRQHEFMLARLSDLEAVAT